MATFQVIDPNVEEGFEEEIITSFRLDSDLKRAAATLGIKEVRFLVDLYYNFQDFRIGSYNRMRKMSEEEEPHQSIEWFAERSEILEKACQGALKVWCEKNPIASWAMSNVGIGPVLAAGLSGHIRKIPQTAGGVWRYAGYDPTAVWEKGQKPPWNRDLKTLCWKIGESFVKFHKHPDCLYGHIYAERKAQQIQLNEEGQFKELADKQLERFVRDTQSRGYYQQGKLPPAHIHMRAKNHAVKIFLSHWHHVAYEVTYGQSPPVPFVFAHLGHQDYIPVPNWNTSKEYLDAVKIGRKVL